MTDAAAGAMPVLGKLDTALSDPAMARRQFEACRAFVWPAIFEPTLLGQLMALCDRAGFRPQEVPGVGFREVEQTALASTAILVALRRPALWRWLEQATGCAPINAVEGQVAQTWPREGDRLGWHDDMVGPGQRRLAITIALNRADFEGGAFELRNVADKSPLLRFQHDVPGRALVFEVSPRTEHRLLPLVSGGPRRLFAGWFIG